MKIELTVKKEFEVEFLQVSAGVRYWDDGAINGECRSDGFDTPCKEGDRWAPIIELETGEIINWDKGNKAEIHYKVCDNGSYSLINRKREVVKTLDGYVPSLMCPKENGHGDYIIMDIDENGMIKDWNCDLSDFENEQED